MLPTRGLCPDTVPAQAADWAVLPIRGLCPAAVVPMRVADWAVLPIRGLHSVAVPAQVADWMAFSIQKLSSVAPLVIGSTVLIPAQRTMQTELLIH